MVQFISAPRHAIGWRSRIPQDTACQGRVQAARTIRLIWILKSNRAGHALPPPKAVAKTLAQFKQVRRLDVSDIQVSESWPDGLRDLDWLVKAVRHSQKARRDEQALDERLTWLNVSKNPALGQQSDPLQGIEVLASLFGT